MKNKFTQKYSFYLRWKKVEIAQRSQQFLFFECNFFSNKKINLVISKKKFLKQQNMQNSYSFLKTRIVI